MPSTLRPQASTPSFPCSGFCQHCGKNHFLPEGKSRQHALDLMAALEKAGRIDLEVSEGDANPLFELDYLYGSARGQMFGILEFRAPDGSHGVLRAFSGQYNGQWQVEGWAPPLFDESTWQQVNQIGEPQIKKLGRQIKKLADHDPFRKELILKRRALSQQLMKDLHATYLLTNFRGESKTLADVFLGSSGMPTGTGDCCAPKLLNYAAKHNLTPLGISEFYLGKENRSQTKEHGAFYPSCNSKCQPILGFLLCGLE